MAGGGTGTCCGEAGPDKTCGVAGTDTTFGAFAPSTIEKLNKLLYELFWLNPRRRQRSHVACPLSKVLCMLAHFRSKDLHLRLSSRIFASTLSACGVMRDE